jgi:hypothetical protein
MIGSEHKVVLVSISNLIVEVYGHLNVRVILMDTLQQTEVVETDGVDMVYSAVIP